MAENQNLDIKKFKKLLEERRKELVELEDMSEEDRKTVELDQQRVGRLSRMEAIQAQALAEEVQDRREHEIMRIDKALHDIEIGEYGHCMMCGEEIEVPRLELDPAITFCIECAKG